MISRTTNPCFWLLWWGRLGTKIWGTSMHRLCTMLGRSPWNHAPQRYNKPPTIKVMNWCHWPLKSWTHLCCLNQLKLVQICPICRWEWYSLCPIARLTRQNLLCGFNPKAVETAEHCHVGSCGCAGGAALPCVFTHGSWGNLQAVETVHRLSGIGWWNSGWSQFKWRKLLK